MLFNFKKELLLSSAYKNKESQELLAKKDEEIAQLKKLLAEKTN